jgi:hypothetical protein
MMAIRIARLRRLYGLSQSVAEVLAALVYGGAGE